MEVLHPHCAGLDVHKDTVVACVRHMVGGTVKREVKTFKTTTTDLMALSEWLAAEGCTRIDTDHPVINEAGEVVSVSNYQAGAGAAWFLLDTSKVVKPFIFQKRRDYQFVAMDSLTDEVVFSAKKFRYGVDCRVNAGYGLWQLAYASKGDLTAGNLDAAIAAMSSVKGDDGKPLNVKPTLLVVPPSLRSTALKLVKAETIEGTSNTNRDVVEVMVCPWLA